MVVPFIMVPKIWLNNKKDNSRRGRVQGNLQDFRYVKLKEIMHRGEQNN